LRTAFADVVPNNVPGVVPDEPHEWPTIAASLQVARLGSTN
jgi:hypothetical protein